MKRVLLIFLCLWHYCYVRYRGELYYSRLSFLYEIMLLQFFYIIIKNPNSFTTSYHQQTVFLYATRPADTLKQLNMERALFGCCFDCCRTRVLVPY
jgi:hypothetical protein